MKRSDKSPTVTTVSIDALFGGEERERRSEELANRHAIGLASIVRDRMDELDMSSVELAIRMGVKPSYVSRLLAGKQNATLKTLAKIEVALEFSIVERAVDADPRPSEA